MAHIYWGNNVTEFVSIQDYGLFKKNETVIFEKTFIPKVNIADRRQIWISAGINKNSNDNTVINLILFNKGPKDIIITDANIAADNNTLSEPCRADVHHNGEYVQKNSISRLNFTNCIAPATLTAYDKKKYSVAIQYRYSDSNSYRNLDGIIVAKRYRLIEP